MREYTQVQTDKTEQREGIVREQQISKERGKRCLVLSAAWRKGRRLVSIFSDLNCVTGFTPELEEGGEARRGFLISLHQFCGSAERERVREGNKKLSAAAGWPFVVCDSLHSVCDE